MNNTEFYTSDQVFNAFPTEKSCIDHLVKLRWKARVMSPFEPFSQVYECKSGRYRCRNTNKYFNVKTGTIFHNTKLPLQTWFVAIWIVSNNNAITSVALSQKLHMTQKSSWYMLQRIKRYLLTENLEVKESLKNTPINTSSKPVAKPKESQKLPLSEWLNLFKS